MSLLNFIKYCLGYVRLTQQGKFLRQEKFSAAFMNDIFSLSGLLNDDLDGNRGELINLQIFYQYDPKNIPQELKERYVEEKAIANKLEDIYNKYKNDQFTKQINFNFGYFEIELPQIIDPSDSIPEDEDDAPKEGAVPDQASTEKHSYPLFTIAVRIEKNNGKYFVFPVDPDIQVNLGVLEPILGEELYYQLVENVSRFEMDGKLSMPIEDLDRFNAMWHLVKSNLKLKEVIFDEASFNLEKMGIALGLRSNYFLAEDLQKLSKMSEDNFDKTSLISWANDKDLSQQTDIPDESELFFPFLYDKFQLRTLSLLQNKASIIQGPPGTGKSETISNLLAHLAATGKKVLFVSQKAQALKVVKDKLKSLEVKYLFGYVPNPRSAQLSEEDEWDGVAPQLAALDAFIEEVEYGSASLKVGDKDQDMTLLARKKKMLKGQINQAIETQRTLFALKNELISLKQYVIQFTDPKKVIENFNVQQFKKIISIRKEIDRLVRLVEAYETSDGKTLLDEKLKHLAWRLNFSKPLAVICDDVARTGYDRHSAVMRKLNNGMRRLRLASYWRGLPREILVCLDEILSSNISRAEAKKEVDLLCCYCGYQENLIEVGKLKTELAVTFENCGLAEAQFDVLESLLLQAANDFEIVLNSLSRVLEISQQVEKLKHDDLNELNESIASIPNSRKQRIANYIQNIIKKHLIKRWKNEAQTRRLIKKLSRALGKSKKAFKTFDRLRNDPDNFKSVLDIIPIWIMELDDASRLIPLDPQLFDYVLLDEASQCNVAYTLPVMYRAKKAIFVGDSEQMRDSTIIFKSNQSFDELARRYQISEEMQIKSTGNAVQSVLDIAALRGFLSIPLRFHYRSPRELISFSNKYFYKPKGKELIVLNSNYLTYENTSKVMLIHQIAPDLTKEISDKISVSEAEEILKFFSILRSNQCYKDKSVGILAFFNAQAAYLREIFEKAGYKEEDDNFKISIIEGIQGDEKDIILYSFVIRDKEQKNKYIPLTGEGGDIRSEVNKGRVNVAFSRARLQVHCFLSMAPADLPEQIWIKKYLQHVQENGDVDSQDGKLSPFDSYFEEEFYHTLKSGLPKHYKIHNQVKSCGFKIDFVLSNTRTGKRLAIECDGPCHFKNELEEELGIYVETDEERQRVLEAAGWSFFRVRYSDWINEKTDRNLITKKIVQSFS